MLQLHHSGCIPGGIADLVRVGCNFSIPSLLGSLFSEVHRLHLTIIPRNGQPPTVMSKIAKRVIAQRIKEFAIDLLIVFIK